MTHTQQGTRLRTALTAAQRPQRDAPRYDTPIFPLLIRGEGCEEEEEQEEEEEEENRDDDDNNNDDE